MNITRITEELTKIAKEVKSIDPYLAEEVFDVTNEIKNNKKHLINKDDEIVCVNPVQGLYKGRIYVAGKEVKPNYIMVYENEKIDELDGLKLAKVGVFRKDRFTRYYKEF